MAVVLPTTPDYILGGYPVYRMTAKWQEKRTTPGDVRLLVIHHTGGTDSRKYLAVPTDGRKVSAHYLVGQYADLVTEPDISGIAIYKYAGEFDDQTFTQGGGKLGGHPGNINEFSVSIEIEGPPIAGVVESAAAMLAGEILSFWRRRGRDLLMIRHGDVDKNKTDPDLDWAAFCKQVYGRVS